MQLYDPIWRPVTPKALDPEVLSLPLTQRVMSGRGMSVHEQAAILQDEPLAFHDPFLLPDMAAACDCIISHLDAGHFILVHGDYDADGVTASTLLVDFLKSIGGKTAWFIPDRLDEGYGLSEKGCDYAIAGGISLVITVDCGVTSVHEADYLRSKGVDLVVTDHHQCGPELPRANAVVDPMRADNVYPWPRLAGAGVALKLVQALCLRLDYGERWKDYIDLAAVGTVADMMPLQNENRAIVIEGLDRINSAPRPGLKALISLQDLASGARPLTAHTVGFRISPPINAAGRMGDSLTGFECLSAADDDRATEKAGLLLELNQQRRDLEAGVISDLIAALKADPSPLDAPVLVVQGESWHPGVLGIVASNLTRRFLRPAIVLAGGDPATFARDRLYKGSARSFGDFNILEAIRKGQDHLQKCGGHAQAAGLTVNADDVDAFKRALAAGVDADPDPAAHFPAQPTIEWDALAQVGELTVNSIARLNALEPYGASNPEPIVLLADVSVTAARGIGRDGSHLRLQVRDADGAEMTCIAFGFGHLVRAMENGVRLALVGTPALNYWNDTVVPQLVVKDIRLLDTDGQFPSRASYAGSDDLGSQADGQFPGSDASSQAALFAGAPLVYDPDTCPMFPKQATAALYTLLKTKLPDGLGMVDPRSLATTISRDLPEPVSPQQVVAILNIFAEAKLLHLSRFDATDCRIICIILRPVTQKVDLYATPTCRKLSDRKEEGR